VKKESRSSLRCQLEKKKFAEDGDDTFDDSRMSTQRGLMSHHDDHMSGMIEMTSFGSKGKKGGKKKK